MPTTVPTRQAWNGSSVGGRPRTCPSSALCLRRLSRCDENRGDAFRPGSVEPADLEDHPVPERTERGIEERVDGDAARQLVLLGPAVEYRRQRCPPAAEELVANPSGCD